MLRIGAAFAAGLLVGGFAVVFASAQTSGGSTKTSVVQMRLYTIDGGTHSWPGGEKGRAQGEQPAPAPDASEVIWEFFASH